MSTELIVVYHSSRTTESSGSPNRSPEEALRGDENETGGRARLGPNSEARSIWQFADPKADDLGGHASVRFLGVSLSPQAASAGRRSRGTGRAVWSRTMQSGVPALRAFSST